MKRKLKVIVKEFQDIFTSPDQAIGKTDLAEFKIMLEPDAVPKKAKVCPLNPAQKKSLRDQLDVWIKEDIIEESRSPWASTLIPVRKWSQP